MLVTAVEQITKKQYKVTFDSEKTIALYLGDLHKFGIKEGSTLSEEKFYTLTDKVILKRAKLKVLQLLRISDQSEYELRFKLKQKYYPEDIIEKAVEYAKDFGYIDDSRVVEQVIKSRISNKSRREIVTYLLGKGINSELIEEGFCNTEQDERMIVKDLLYKKVKPGETITPEKSKKLYGYLLRKGFPATIVMNCMKEICAIQEDGFECYDS